MLAAGSNEAFHWYARAMELRSLGRLEEALGAHEDVREKYPDYVPTYLMAAQIAGELGREDEARDWATRGVGHASAQGETKAASELSAFLDLLG